MSEKSVNKIIGSKLLLTNRSNGTITLQAGKDETLLIKGTIEGAISAGSGVLPISQELSYTSSTVSSITTLQQAETSGSENFKQGYRVKADRANDSILITCNSTNDFPRPEPQAGQAIIYNSDLSLNVRLDCPNQESCMSELVISGSIYNDTCAVQWGIFDIADGERGSTYIYKKSAGSWTLNQTISDVSSMESSLYNNTLVLEGLDSFSNCSIWTRASSSTAFAQSQTLGYVAGTSDVYTVGGVDYITTTSGGTLYLYESTGGQFSLVSSTSLASFSKSVLLDTAVVGYGSGAFYVFDYDLLLKYVITKSINDFSGYENYIVMSTSTGIEKFSISTNNYIPLWANNTNTGSAISLNNSYVILGDNTKDNSLGCAYAYNISTKPTGSIMNTITGTIDSMSIVSPNTLYINTNSVASSSTSTGALVVSGDVASRSLYTQSITASGLNVSSIQNTNSVITNITTTTLRATNEIATNITTTTLNATNEVATNITTTALNTTSLIGSVGTLGALTVSGNFYVNNIKSYEYVSALNNGGNGTAQAISTSSFIAVNDDAYGHSLVSSYVSAGMTLSNGVYTATRGGLFLCIGNVGFEENGTGIRSMFWSLGNNTSLKYGYVSQNACSAGITPLNNCVIIPVNTNSNIRLYVYQTSGSTLGLVGNGQTDIYATRVFRLCDL